MALKFGVSRKEALLDVRTDWPLLALTLINKWYSGVFGITW